MTEYESIMLDANNMYRAFFKSVENSKWKTSSQKAIIDCLDIVFETIDSLRDRTYTSRIDQTFIIRERGRVRKIDSFAVKDRAIRHILCDDILIPKIKNKIIYDNGASIPGRGISHARKRIEIHMHRYYNQHKSNIGYILLGDYSKYYDNILHKVAKEQLMQLVDYDEYLSWLIDRIFNGFDIDISYLSDIECDELYFGLFNKLEYEYTNSKNPERTLHKSISIGDQLSQIIGIYYPHEIDNYVKIIKRQKYYGRYMDDWYIISDNVNELNDILYEVESLASDLGMHLNLNKTHIAPIYRTFKYLQNKYYLTDTGRLVIRINPKRISEMRRRLKKLANKVHNGDIPYAYAEEMFRSWMGSFYKILSRKQRYDLFALYEQLFCVMIEIKDNKMVFYSDY